MVPTPLGVRGLTRTLYNYICADDGLSVFKADSCWVPLRKCIILDQDFRREEISNITLVALKALVCISRNDFKVIDIPEIILKTILQTCWKEMLTKRFVSKQEFYLNWFLPRVSFVSPIERDLLILHALSDEFLCGNLNDVKCIPVSPDGKALKTIEELIDPSSILAKLFDTTEGRFPMWTSGRSTDGYTPNMKTIMPFTWNEEQ